MQIITYTNPKLLIADEGKYIRDINDIYQKEHIDEEGNFIDKHYPNYSTVIFLADNFDIEKIDEQYVEEIIKNS